MHREAIEANQIVDEHSAGLRDCSCLFLVTFSSGSATGRWSLRLKDRLAHFTHYVRVLAMGVSSPGMAGAWIFALVWSFYCHFRNDRIDYVLPMADLQETISCGVLPALVLDHAAARITAARSTF